MTNDQMTRRNFLPRPVLRERAGVRAAHQLRLGPAILPGHWTLVIGILLVIGIWSLVIVTSGASQSVLPIPQLPRPIAS
jgi:hypothetical protein